MAKKTKKKYSYIDRVNHYSVKFGKVKTKTGKAFCAGYVDSYHDCIDSSFFNTDEEKKSYYKGVGKSLKERNKALSLKF